MSQREKSGSVGIETWYLLYKVNTLSIALYDYGYKLSRRNIENTV